MSRGFGLLQRYLLSNIAFGPMTFEQILAQACPEFFENDKSEFEKQWLASSNCSPTRSLRRALAKLCDAGVIQVMGHCRPHHYRLHQIFKTCEYNPERIALLYLILKNEGAMTPVGPNPCYQPPRPAIDVLAEVEEMLADEKQPEATA